MLELHGEHPSTFPASDALCNALQVLNHLQDCRQDYLQLDRIYIPQAWLTEAEQPMDVLGNERVTTGLRAVIDRCLDSTTSLLQKAKALPQQINSRRLRMETITIMEIAKTLTNKLGRHDPLAEHVTLFGVAVCFVFWPWYLRCSASPTRRPTLIDRHRHFSIYSSASDACMNQQTRMVRDLVARSGTSFYWGMRLLPKAQREGMYALYTFCRIVDDIADGVDDPSRKNRLLDDWQQIVTSIYEGSPKHAVAVSLAAANERYELPRIEFLAILDGCRMDTGEQVRMETMEDLYQYIRRVAGAVGILAMQIFGVRQDPGPDFATELGAAFQLTNILRDVQEDAERGRLYMPLALLRRHGIPTDSLQQILRHDNLAAVRAELADLANAHFERSEALLGQLPRRRLLPALIMRRVYRANYDRMAARGWHNLEPIRLGRAHKAWLAFQAVLAR